jgi:DNA-binding response OmpR family regulator
MPDIAEQRIIANRLVLHPAHYEARLDGKLLSLTARQFHVLTLLASEKGRAVKRRRLAEHIGAHGHQEDMSDRAVDNLISRLRKRLGPGLSIESVRGVGYRLVADW